MTRRRAVAALIVALAVGASACAGGSDDESASDAGVPGTVDSAPTTEAEPADDDTSPTDAAGSAAPGPIGDGAGLSAADICERLAAESVTADLGVEIVAAEPQDSATPQCAYLYRTATGGVANATVALMRPDDVGGATGQAAFDAVVAVNESIAGDDADRQELDAGDGALRLSGAALHLGILRLGDHVFTLVVPAADTDADDVDRMIVTMATALGDR